MSTRLSWFPASVLSSRFQTIQKTESPQIDPIPKIPIFLLLNLQYFIVHQKDISLFRFSFLFRCVNLTFSKAISICTADASNLKQEAAAQFFNPSFWEIVLKKKSRIVDYNIFQFLKNISQYAVFPAFPLYYKRSKNNIRIKYSCQERKIRITYETQGI